MEGSGIGGQTISRPPGIGLHSDISEIFGFSSFTLDFSEIFGGKNGKAFENRVLF
jgi:hypothetical protein